MFATLLPVRSKSFFGRTVRVKPTFSSSGAAAPRPCSIIIVGFADNGIVFFRGVGAEPLEEASSPEYYVIGSGSLEAMEVLTRRKQSIHTTLARSLLHVSEALAAARKGQKTVGPPADYVIIRPNNVGSPNGMMRFPAKSYLLRDWSKHYRKRKDTSSLDRILPNQQAAALLRRLETMPSQMLSHESVKLEPLDFPANLL